MRVHAGTGLAGTSPGRSLHAQVADVLLGAGLVAIGVLAAALGDRIRGIRLAGARAADGPRDRHPAAGSHRVLELGELVRPRPVAKCASRSESGAQSEADDVIAALVAAGYKQPVAAEAVWGCDATERETVESWTRVALRRARGAAA